ncbi:unnamed protein product [Macrosiphum euphorbiae]|uniref:Uncharacterized protein n=1 Tax=Macrosiphum euphorbiae TaxID=13131 RepID=A0AAV0VSP0_9HEMI|nr:unnamed protein product [Macrosiphum euphorbiae]
MNTKILIDANTIKNSAIKRIVMVNRRLLSRKRHNRTLVCIKAKTNTACPIGKNIEVRHLLGPYILRKIVMSSANRRSLAFVIYLVIELTNKINRSGLS